MKRRVISRLRITRQIIQSIFCSLGFKPTEHSKKYMLLLQIMCFLMQTYSYILHGFFRKRYVRWEPGHCGQHIDWTKVVETISRGSILGMDKKSLLQSFHLGMVPT
jgi:hypothetical protein